MKQKLIPLPVIISFFLLILLVVFSLEIPFFWDEVHYIGTAFSIYDSNFQSFIPRLEHDQGNFPFYGFYMALSWKLLGKSVTVSHFAMLPILTGIVWEYFMISKRIIPSKWLFFVLLLFLLDPTFITQSVLMGHDIFLLYFFMLSLRSILYENRFIYAIAIFLLAFHNVKGIPYAFSISIFYFFNRLIIEKKKLNLTDWIIHLVSLFAWGVWLLYHKKITGWYILTPVGDYGNIFHISLSFLKRVILSLWQIADFGRIFLIILVIYFLFFMRKMKLEVNLKKILLAGGIISGISVIFFSLIDVNLCHRYFFPIFIFLQLLASYFVVYIVYIKCRWIVILTLYVGLITGNFWIYGGGFSNGWDASLKILPYFELKNKMDSFVKEQNINPVEIGTKFPLYQGGKYAYLAEKNFHYANMQTDFIEKYNYVLLSNVSNEFTVSEKEKLNSTWILIKELSKGQVYLRLFKNPNAQ